MPCVSEKWGGLYPPLQKVGVRVPPVPPTFYAYMVRASARVHGVETPMIYGDTSREITSIRVYKSVLNLSLLCEAL